MSSSSSSWRKLPDAPFQFTDCARTPVLVDNDTILLSPIYDEYLYTFNIKTDEWNKCHFGESSFEGHVMCISNDKKHLYIYEGFEQILMILDIETMKITKEITDICETEAFPVLIADDNTVHIIGGHSNKFHIMVDIITEQTKEIHKFSKKPEGAACVHIKHKNILLLFHGDISLHSYELYERKWTDLNIKMPRNVKSFGYILSSDEKYVIICGGYLWNGKQWQISDVIDIFDIEHMKYIECNIKCPASQIVNAVMDNAGDIHLFLKNKHWKMNINQILSEYEEEKEAVDKQRVSVLMQKMDEMNERIERLEHKLSMIVIWDNPNDIKNKFAKMQQQINTLLKNQTVTGKLHDESKAISADEKLRLWMIQTVKLPQYADLLIENGYDDMQSIAHITVDELEILGVDKIGHRKKIARNAHKSRQIALRSNLHSRQRSINNILTWICKNCNTENVSMALMCKLCRIQKS